MSQGLAIGGIIAHNILGEGHADANTGTVLRGDLIYGNGATPAWDRLTVGTVGQVLTSDGTDVAWAAAAGGSHALLDGSTVTDSVAATVTRGSIVYANATPKWDELVVGSANDVLLTDGTDVAWTALDHGTHLAGLTDDDHTQYALLLGRSGGQTINGGTASGDDLILNSTSDATKGTIILGGTVVDNRVVINGTEDSVVIATTTFPIRLSVHDQTAGQVEMLGGHKHSDTAGSGANLVLARTRGTDASETVVVSGDNIGTIFAIGHDGTDFAQAATIEFNVDGTPGAGDMPGNIIFSTSADGAEAPIVRLTIDSAGLITAATDLLIGGGASASELRLLEPSGGGSSYTGFASPALAANVIYTLPIAHAAVTGYVLSATDAGVLSWVAQSGGGNVDLLDGSVHQDTTASSAVRGSVIIGDATPDWTALGVGGANEVLTSDGTDVAWAAAAGANHAILDGSVHSDSVADGVTRGSLIYGNATPKWDELVVGGAATILTSDGTDISWAAPVSQTSALLSTTHTDTLAAAVTQGSIIIGNVTPAWSELVIGAANRVLTSDGTTASWAQADHGLALAGLTDDDHTQYALLAGRSGGQTIHGGTGTGEGLTIQSTSDATKGNVVIEETVAVVLGGGTTATELRLLEPSAGGSEYTGFIAPALVANVIYTLPTAHAAVTGYVLSSTDAGVLSWIASAGSAHAILDGSVHSDSVADAVTRGSIIYGNATPKWDELVIGTSGFVLTSDGTDIAWAAAAGGGGTQTVLLPIAAAELDDTKPPGVTIVNNLEQLNFNAAADEFAHWTFRLPASFSSAPVLKLGFAMTSATTGDVIWAAEVWAISPGDAVDTDTESYDTANIDTETVPGTAGYLDEASITLTNFDSAVAGDRIVIRVSRDANAGGDTATGDAELRTCSLEFTAA